MKGSTLLTKYAQGVIVTSCEDELRLLDDIEVLSIILRESRREHPELRDIYVTFGTFANSDTLTLHSVDR